MQNKLHKYISKNPGLYSDYCLNVLTDLDIEITEKLATPLVKLDLVGDRIDRRN
jgi:hypothetical protein